MLELELELELQRKTGQVSPVFVVCFKDDESETKVPLGRSRRLAHPNGLTNPTNAVQNWRHRCVVM